jgi:hypothetical protein
MKLRLGRLGPDIRMKLDMTVNLILGMVGMVLLSLKNLDIRIIRRLMLVIIIGIRT